MLRCRPDDVLQRQDEGAHPEEDGRGGRRRGGLPPHGVSEMPDALRMPAPRAQMEARRGAVPVQGHGHHAIPGGAASRRLVDAPQPRPEAEAASAPRAEGRLMIATAATPATAATAPP